MPPEGFRSAATALMNGDDEPERNDLEAARPLTDEELVEGVPPYIRESLLRMFKKADDEKRMRERRRRLRELAASRARRRTRPLGPGDEIGTSKTFAVPLPT